MQIRGRLPSRKTLSSAVLAVALASLAFFSSGTYAAQITNRSLTLEAGSGGDAGSKVGGVVNHHFKFTLPGGSVGAVVLRYCTVAGNINDPCTTPTGLVTTSSTSGSQVGATGFTLNNSTNGQPFFTRSAATVNPNTPVELTLQSVTNPTTNPISGNPTFFVRIASYTQSAPNITTDTPVDEGTVAASTATQIQLSGTMPESLIFCAGAQINVNGGGIPDCSTVTTGLVNFNQLFSPTDTATAKSQLAASTNAAGGYSISVNGSTLTSGSNTIPAMATAALGSRGTGQFGMNLVANTTTTSTPAVGTNVTPAANVGAQLRGQALTGYDTPDTFKFVSGDPVANSAAGGAGPTNSQIFTVSYIANVPGSQPAGSYTTTLTYICTATF